MLGREAEGGGPENRYPGRGHRFESCSIRQIDYFRRGNPGVVQGSKKMRYVSGIHALNLNCSLETTGDWHQSALRWKDVTFRDTENSVFGDYGIEYDKEIPEHEGKFAIANHLRALLDLLEEGKFTVVEGMKDDYICTDKYDREFFQKVVLLKNSVLWHKIDAIMANEFMMKWKKFKEAYNV